jgi:hypothetical protein
VLDPTKIAELAARRAAAPDHDWNAVDAWIIHALRLIRPGGVLSVVLPDGEPFIARRAQAADPG